MAPGWAIICARLAARWALPRDDDWSTPFAEALLDPSDLVPGATILTAGEVSGDRGRQ
ncbi:MAG TPA: hypothetical protein VLA99_14060 [Nitrospiraceae bacterium]|nr:hypothetical protein [Nitrospiraceae bacterium]